MQTPTLWGNRAAGIMCISSIAKIELDLRFRSICVIVGFVYSGLAILLYSLFFSNYLETELLAAK